MEEKSTIIQEAIKVIKDGGVIAIRSDTIYSLSCDATSDQAIAKTFNIKQRKSDKPYVILFKSIEQLLQYTHVNKATIHLLEHFTEGLTVIIPYKLNDTLPLASMLPIKNNSIAIRISKKGDLAELMQDINIPLISTSINISGQAYLNNYNEIREQFDNIIDYIAPPLNSSHSLVKATPSTILDMTLSNRYKILRHGSISSEELQKQVSCPINV